MGTFNTTSYLQLTLEFATGNSQILLIPNPRDDISASAINNISSFISNNHLILGDNAASFVKISKATTVAKTSAKDTFNITA